MTVLIQTPPRVQHLYLSVCTPYSPHCTHVYCSPACRRSHFDTIELVPILGALWGQQADTVGSVGCKERDSVSHLRQALAAWFYLIPFRVTEILGGKEEKIELR